MLKIKDKFLHHGYSDALAESSLKFTGFDCCKILIICISFLLSISCHAMFVLPAHLLSAAARSCNKSLTTAELHTHYWVQMTVCEWPCRLTLPPPPLSLILPCAFPRRPPAPLPFSSFRFPIIFSIPPNTQLEMGHRDDVDFTLNSTSRTKFAIMNTTIRPEA